IQNLFRETATLLQLWYSVLSVSHASFAEFAATILESIVSSTAYDDGITNFRIDECDYISFIDHTLNQCPANLNLKKFKLDIDYNSVVNSEFKSRANSWIRFAISRNDEDVDLWLWDAGVGQYFTYDDELFFNNLCFTRVKLSYCLFNPPNGAISWERLKCLCLFRGTLDEDMIEKILSGSPCLESLELDLCYGYRRIDVTSKSVKKLVFSGYYSNFVYEKDYIDYIKINAPYISSLT
ncbi:hypothetical protein Tco_1529029, partial [Tanacetum coccineum]